MTKLIINLTLNTLVVASGGILLGEGIVIRGRRLYWLQKLKEPDGVVFLRLEELGCLFLGPLLVEC